MSFEDVTDHESHSGPCSKSHSSVDENEDEPELAHRLGSEAREVLAGLREGRVIEFADWKKVDAEEVRRGEALGKERERMGWEEAREFLAKTKPT